LNRRSFLGAGALVATSAIIRPASATIGDDPIPPQMHAALQADTDLFGRARDALARNGARIAHRDVMAVIDFSAPSHRPRLHLVDLIAGRSETYLVAHGRGSDPSNTGWVERFSNRPGSNASSNGAFLTGDSYVGKHGASRKLIGLEPQNSQAESRAIVIHAADYVSAQIARDQGRIGRSQGCFALARPDLVRILARLGPGRLLYADKG
jgi:hypothetical protein